jgi:type II secretory pathway predicted ATPase ExeA
MPERYQLAHRMMQRRHLAQAERHIAQGAKHIAKQELMVADLGRLGYDTTEARKLLDNFYASQVLHMQHRDRILEELGE